MAATSRFIEACFCRSVDRTPVWLMRQAGRYQPSYRAIRKDLSFMQLCKTPELAAQITVNAVSELGVDAAILFSDILIPLEGMGAAVEITDQGPVLADPVRDAAAIDKLRVCDPQASTPFVFEAVRQARAALPSEVPLIGFAGAPLTLASYLVEGGNTKTYAHLRQLLFGDPKSAHRLLERLAQSVALQLRAQVEAGCQAVQLFDSWGGILSPADYRELCLPYLQQIFAELAPTGVPRILFATCSSTLLEVMAESGAEVIGLDWRVELAEARRRLGPALALQGNLDPGCLFLADEALVERVARILAQAGGHPGHIFNLGHGVLPPTDPKKARLLVQTVQRLSAAERR